MHFDVRTHADDVIWAGDEGWFQAPPHRGFSTGHNTGFSQAGPPTAKMVVWAIANCSAIENEIFQEWVLYNTGSMLRSWDSM